MRKCIIQLLAIVSLFSTVAAQTPGACLKSTTPVPYNGNGSLGLSYQDSGCGLNYVQGMALIETRFDSFSTAVPPNIGTGLPTSISISGIPASASVQNAYLWYMASYQSATAPTTTVTMTNPNSQTNTYTVTLIGKDQSACWGETGTAAYRADVTSNISGNGLYLLNIAGFTNPNWEVVGANLIIIYSDINAPYQGTLVIHDGMRTGVGNAYIDTITGISTCANSTYANGFVLVGDMQDNVNSNAHPSTINGNVSNFTNDFWNFDTASTSVLQGQTSAIFGTDGLGSDCFGWVAMGLYYQTQCVVCCTTLTVFANATGTGCVIGNASASALVGCGAPPYSYLWSTGATTQTITGLAAGTYTITVTDSLSQTASATVTVNSTVLSGSVTVTASSCSANNGMATINVSNGVSPLSYLWSNSQTTQTITGLAVGIYSVTVTDSMGCTTVFSTTVTNGTMTGTIFVSNVSCFGGSNGTATVNTSGGNAPYTYQWSNGHTTAFATGLSAGSYSVLVTDGGGCTISVSATVTGAPMLITNTNNTPSSCWNCPDGSAGTNVIGGTPPYTYNWTPGGQSTANIVGLVPGMYAVCVTDSKGCMKCDTLWVLYVGVNEILNSSVSISPNPSSGNFTIDFGGINFGKADITLFNLVGEKILEVKSNAYGKQEFDASVVPSGIYFLKLKTDKGTVSKKLIINR